MALQDIGSQLATAETLATADLVALRTPAWDSWLSSSSFRTIVNVIGDLVAGSLSYELATWTQQWIHPAIAGGHSNYHFFVYSPFLVVFLYLCNAYDNHGMRRPEAELEVICKAASLGFLGFILANFAGSQRALSPYLLVTWYLSSLLLLLAIRFGVRGLYLTLWRRGFAQRTAVLVGSDEDLVAFQATLSLQRHKAYRIAGLVILGEIEEQRVAQLGAPIMGSIDQWEEISRSQSLDLIVICSPSASVSQQLALDILSRCPNRKVEVQLRSDLFGAAEYEFRQDEFSGYFRFGTKPIWSRPLQLLIKNLIDRLIGLAGSFFALMLTPLVGALIKLDDGGPIFYRSAYLDRNGEVQYYLKFRSMCLGADEKLTQTAELRSEFERKCKLENDPRVTRVGRILRKYSVDEFPQFFSVLSGKLSFVGPRTIRKEEGLRYGPLLPKLLTFKPGLTGFWQVMGRQTTSYQDRINMDMFYIDHWSIWLDLIIMAKTVWITLKAEGAY